MTWTFLNYLISGLAYGLPLLVAITSHEAAHGYIAWKLGDETALRRGRVTFNPLKHIDLFGTLLLPLTLLLLKAPFLFGYAKPVPVNFQNLLKPRRDTILVAAAGPVTNLMLAILSALLLKLIIELFKDSSIVQGTIVQGLIFSLKINVVLAVFNMIPLPPLDGSRIVASLLPPKLAYSYNQLERWGFFILFGFIFILPMILGQLGIAFNPLAYILGPPVSILLNMLLTLVGLS